jgi:hypothetical protein
MKTALVRDDTCCDAPSTTSRIFVRGNVVVLLAVALMCVCGAASSSIVYNVNVTDGFEVISGTITTDGVIGALSAADISAWDLTATGAIPFGPHLSSPALGVDCGSVCGITATLNGLFGQAPPPVNGFLEFLYVDASGGSHSIDILTGGDFIAQTPAGGLTARYQLLTSAPYVVGTTTASTVPEPTTAMLVGLAMTCVGFVRKLSSGGAS